MTGGRFEKMDEYPPTGPYPPKRTLHVILEETGSRRESDDQSTAEAHACRHHCRVTISVLDGGSGSCVTVVAPPVVATDPSE